MSFQNLGEGMKRRDITRLLGGAIMSPLAARAQQKATSVVGLLSIVSSDPSPALPYFRQGLAENGFVEGRNLTIEYRFAEFHPERLPDLAKDLVQKNVSVIAAVSGLPTALAAKSATASLPIIFILPGDPVQAGL